MFLLFLDCVWQILHQFPCSFEFNEHFLVTLFEHAYASQFGTFLGNNENERLVRLLALNPLNIRLCLVKMLLDLEKVRVMVCSFWTQVSFSCCCCTVCCSARGLLLLSGTWAGQHSAPECCSASDAVLYQWSSSGHALSSTTGVQEGRSPTGQLAAASGFISCFYLKPVCFQASWVQ